MVGEIDWTATGTFVVAVGTGALAVATLLIAKRTREALRATIRPILVDVPLDAPGTARVTYADASEHLVGTGSVHVLATEDYVFCSLPLRNVGPGVAVIRGLGLREPPCSGNVSRMVVPRGEATRFSFSVPRDRPELQEGIESMLGGRFILEARYTDADGGQDTITRAFVLRLKDDRYRVRQVALLHPGDEQPFAMSGPADG
jgi:hypothetical protein